MSSSSKDGSSQSLYVGLMSGTSIDSIDAAIIECSHNATKLIATREHPIPAATRNAIAAISHSGEDEIERMGALDRELGRLFAEATIALLQESNTPRDAITAIGSHGQTIRHRPPSSATLTNECFTVQIGDPNTIAENTGITTVADFRRRDIAAGGQGAPLAPAFHADVFSAPGINRAIINIGGIANASILRGNELVMGFDTGPGNTLLDQWNEKHTGQRYDAEGDWAAEGQIIATLLESMLQHPFLHRKGPRSTGKEAFNMAWLTGQIEEFHEYSPQDIQATLAEFTAKSIVWGIQSSEVSIQEVYICGGGAHNTDLMRRLYGMLDPVLLANTSAVGMEPDWVEAAAFGWLARQTIEGLAGNAPAVTGAKGLRILGGVYPGSIV